MLAVNLKKIVFKAIVIVIKTCLRTFKVAIALAINLIMLLKLYKKDV